MSGKKTKEIDSEGEEVDEDFVEEENDAADAEDAEAQDDVNDDDDAEVGEEEEEEEVSHAVFISTRKLLFVIENMKLLETCIFFSPYHENELCAIFCVCRP
jgi:hypothetical protein